MTEKKKSNTELVRECATNHREDTDQRRENGGAEPSVRRQEITQSGEKTHPADSDQTLNTRTKGGLEILRLEIETRESARATSDPQSAKLQSRWRRRGGAVTGLILYITELYVRTQRAARCIFSTHYGEEERGNN